MAELSWTNSGGDGDWANIANWSTGAIPVNADKVYFSPSATAGPTLNVDRTTEVLVLARMETLPDCTYNIASSASPLICTVSDAGGSTNVGPVIHRGSGTFYWNSLGGSGQVLVDSPNAQNAMVIGGAASMDTMIINNGRVTLNMTGTIDNLFLVPRGITTTLSLLCSSGSLKVTSTIIEGGFLDTNSRHRNTMMRGGRVICRNDLGGQGFGLAYVTMYSGVWDHRQDGALDFGNTLYFYAIGGTLDTKKIPLVHVNRLYRTESATILRGAGLVIDNEYILNEEL